MNSNIKTAIFWVVLICLAVLLWTIVRQGKQGAVDQIKFTDFIDQVKDKKVKDVTIAANEVQAAQAAQQPLRIERRDAANLRRAGPRRIHGI